VPVVEEAVRAVGAAVLRAIGLDFEYVRRGTLVARFGLPAALAAEGTAYGTDELRRGRAACAVGLRGEPSPEGIDLALALGLDRGILGSERSSSLCGAEHRGAKKKDA